MTHIQILESGDETGLKYKATEKEWESMLSSAGLLKIDEENEGRKTTHGTTEGTIDANEEIINTKKDQTPYFVVSIMGPQSSGKSTILNLLFGCTFNVMDHTQGRKQVTTGIWLGGSPKTKNVLVMDLEGTDAIERKLNRGNFERQTSLMALTLSEVLIVNMWANDIGRASGMNVDTLRSILEANLRLFSPNAKTTLLFLIREQSPDESQLGVTPAKVQETTIRGIVNDIWQNIEKPESYSKTQLTDLFDIHFFFMPPLVFFRDKFNEKVQELFKRLTDPKDPNYYFNNSYHYRKSVPPEGLFTWTSQIWDAISKDEILNIPDQQKLLSSYRCEHAMNESFKKFLNQAKKIQDDVQDHYIENFGNCLNEIIVKCVYEYNLTADKYDEDEAKDKYAQLVDKIETHVQYLFTFQVKHLISECLEKYEKEIHKILPKNECVRDFRNVTCTIMEQIQKYFNQQIATCMINTDNNDLLDEEIHGKELQKRLLDVSRSLQSEQLKLLQNENNNLIEEHFSQISKMIRDPSSNVWNKLSSLRIHYHGNVLKNIIQKFDNLMYENNETKEEKRRLLSDSVDEHIISICKQYVDRIDNILAEQFDIYFNKEEKTGIPRDWKSSMNVKDIFVQSKEKCLKILESCENITLEENKDLNLSPIRLRLLKSERVNEIRNSFDRYCDNEYRKVEEIIRRRDFITSGLFPTNPVAWIIFLFFAWNEIISMLKNPLLLIIFIFVVVILFIVYQAHSLGFNVQTIAKTMFLKFFHIVQWKFQETLNIRTQKNIKKNSIFVDDNLETHDDNEGSSNYYIAGNDHYTTKSD